MKKEKDITQELIAQLAKPTLIYEEKVEKELRDSYMAEFNANELYLAFIAGCCEELMIQKPKITVDETVRKVYLPELLYDELNDTIRLDSHFMRDMETTLFSLAYALRRKGMFEYEKDFIHSRWGKIECAAYALYKLHETPHTPEVLYTNFFMHYSEKIEKEIIKEYIKKLQYSEE